MRGLPTQADLFFKFYTLLSKMKDLKGERYGKTVDVSNDDDDTATFWSKLSIVVVLPFCPAAFNFPSFIESVLSLQVTLGLSSSIESLVDNMIRHDAT